MNAPAPRTAKAVRSTLAILRSYAAKLLILFTTVCLCLLVLEWLVRWALPWYNPRTQVPFHMTAYGVALGAPGQTARQATPKGDYDSLIRFHEYGFRDQKNLREASERDWFALGDSFTMGWGVEEEERFSNRLEQRFRTNGIPARVFNIAIPDNLIGYQRLLKYAESRGARVRHLVVGICMENDLHDYSDGKSDWDFVPDAKISRKESVRAWLKSHSALYIAASFSQRRIPFVRRLVEWAGLAHYVNEASGKVAWSETVLKSSRDQLVKLVAGRDSLIVIIPSRHLWLGSDRETAQRIHAEFIRLLREAGVEVLDLKSAFEGQGDPLGCYFKTDPHWNAHGHDLAAQELFKAIEARGRSN